MTMNRQPAQPPFGNPTEQAVSMNYGYDIHHVFVVFNMPIRDLRLTPEQVDKMIECLKGTKEEMLKKFGAKH